MSAQRKTSPIFFFLSDKDEFQSGVEAIQVEHPDVICE